MQYQHSIAFLHEGDAQKFVAEHWLGLEHLYIEVHGMDYLGPIRSVLGYIASYISFRPLGDAEILEALHAHGAVEVTFDEVVPVDEEELTDDHVAMYRHVLFGTHRGFGGESL